MYSKEVITNTKKTLWTEIVIIMEFIIAKSGIILLSKSRLLVKDNIVQALVGLSFHH